MYSISEEDAILVDGELIDKTLVKKKDAMTTNDSVQSKHVNIKNLSQADEGGNEEKPSINQACLADTEKDNTKEHIFSLEEDEPKYLDDILCITWGLEVGTIMGE